MESLYLLVPLSVAFVLLIGWVFHRALSSGQFDDLERHGHSVLEEEAATALDLNQEAKRPGP